MSAWNWELEIPNGTKERGTVTTFPDFDSLAKAFNKADMPTRGLVMMSAWDETRATVLAFKGNGLAWVQPRMGDFF